MNAIFYKARGVGRFLNCPDRTGGIKRKVIWELLDLKQQTWGKGLKQKWAEILILRYHDSSPYVAVEAGVGAEFTHDGARNATDCLCECDARTSPGNRLCSNPSAISVGADCFSPRAVGEAWEGKIEVLDAEQGDITTYVAKLDETRPPSKCLR